MNKNIKKDYLEEALIRLIALEWVLDCLDGKQVCSINCLADFFKTEIKKCLVSFDKYYHSLSNPNKRVPKKGVKNAIKKRKEPKNSIKKHKQVKRRGVSTKTKRSNSSKQSRKV